jgi:hypothetical protein
MLAFYQSGITGKGVLLLSVKSRNTEVSEVLLYPRESLDCPHVLAA